MGMPLGIALPVLLVLLYFALLYLVEPMKKRNGERERSRSPRGEPPGPHSSRRAG
jgi:hypothetical protein